MLQVSDLHVYYGVSHVLWGVSLEVRPGEIVCLLGRNGAGKSTTMRGIVGVSPPKSGKVRLNGEDLAGKPAYENVRRGLAFVPEDRRIFPGLTVNENLEVAVLPPRQGYPSWTIDRIYRTFPFLAGLKSRKGGNLSGGQQQQLAIARALVTDPKVLLLDEPTEGIQPSIIKDIERVIRMLAARGDMAILLVEQYYDFARDLADHYLLMERGEFIMRGLGANMDQDGVREALAV